MTVEEKILQIVRNHWPTARVLKVWPLNGGISATMTAFQIQNGHVTRIYCLRQVSNWQTARNPLAATHEFQLQLELGRQGYCVPAPVLLDPANHQYLIEYIEGEPNLNPADISDYLAKYANQLSRIHAAKTDELGFLPRQILSSIERQESENERLGEATIKDILARLQSTIQLNAPVLRHGDYWPGNVLWRQGQIVGVIDWENGMIGEPLADLAIARLDILWLFGENAMHDFTACYLESTNVNLASLPYWDLVASVRCINDFERMAPAYPLLGRFDVTVETLETGLQLFVSQAIQSI